MINQLSQVNWISVLAAFFAYFIIGALWFTVFFKKQYAVSLGKENSVPAKPSPIFIIGPAVCSLFIIIASALLMQVLGVSTYGQAIEFALVVGVGYLVANTFNIAINPNMPYPLHYGVISGAYHLTGILISCVILVAMR